jgi:uncharacterized protein YbjT (DUF2867 family)
MTARTETPRTVLVVGATGSIGHHVLAAAVRQGHSTRALVRDTTRASVLDPAVQVVEGQLTDPATLLDRVALRLSQPDLLE